MKNIDVLVIGAGQAGAGLHVPSYRTCEAVTVAGIVDPNIDRARQVAQQKGIPGAYASLSDALAARRFDAVSVCSPPDTHLPVARQAMEAGCAVLLEKPMTVTLEETDELMAVQKKTKGRLCVVHQNKYTRGIRRIVEIVRSGEAGDVLQLHQTWLSNGDLDRMSAEPNFWCHKIPGGRWAESLPHQLYIAYSLVGPMELRSVEARKSGTRWPWMSADEVLVTLESRTGYVTVRMSATIEQRKRSISLLHGTKASYAFSYKTANRITPSQRTAKDLLTSGIGAVPSAVSKLVRGEHKEQPHEYVIQQFVRSLRGEGEPPTTLEEAYEVMRLTHEFGVAYEEAVAERIAAR